MILIRFFFKTLELFSIKWTAYFAFHLFQRTAKETIRPRERAFYSKFKKEIHTDEYGTFSIIHNLQESIKESREVYLLVHGWNSNLASMSSIANLMDEQGKQFIAFNLPGHANDGSRKSNVFISKNRLRTVLSHFSASARIHLITHSFGSAVTSFALSEENRKVGQLIFLTSPNKIKEVFIGFGAVLKLKVKTVNKIIGLGEVLLGESAKEAVVAKKLKSCEFESLLIIHDKKDKIIPFRTAEEINKEIENSKVVAFDGIGHYRMLSNMNVLNEIKTFIN